MVLYRIGQIVSFLSSKCSSGFPLISSRESKTKVLLVPYLALHDLHHPTGCILTLSPTPVLFAHSTATLGTKQVFSSCRSFLVTVPSSRNTLPENICITYYVSYLINYSVTYFLTTPLKIFIPAPLVRTICLPHSVFPCTRIPVFHIMYFTYLLA